MSTRTRHQAGYGDTDPRSRDCNALLLVDALYARPAELPADDLGPNMARLNREHSRMLGNGYCIRPQIMDYIYETICESCTFFQTTIEFRPTLLAQRDDACAKGQIRRSEIYDNLLTAGRRSPRLRRPGATIRGGHHPASPLRGPRD